MSDGHHPPRVFDFGAPAICTQAFTFNGREFEIGESFPYEELKLERHRMHGLWSACLVDFVRLAPRPAPEKKRQRAARV